MVGADRHDDRAEHAADKSGEGKVEGNLEATGTFEITLHETRLPGKERSGPRKPASPCCHLAPKSRLDAHCKCEKGNLHCTPRVRIVSRETSPSPAHKRNRAVPPQAEKTYEPLPTQAVPAIATQARMTDVATNHQGKVDAPQRPRMTTPTLPHPGPQLFHVKHPHAPRPPHPRRTNPSREDARGERQPSRSRTESKDAMTPVATNRQGKVDVPRRAGMTTPTPPQTVQAERNQTSTKPSPIRRTEPPGGGRVVTESDFGVPWGGDHPTPTQRNHALNQHGRRLHVKHPQDPTRERTRAALTQAEKMHAPTLIPPVPAIATQARMTPVATKHRRKVDAPRQASTATPTPPPGPR